MESVSDQARIAELLERVGNLVRAMQREVAGRHGLQPVHLSALSYLTRANRYSDTPAAVTEYLGVTKGTASQTLLLLERKGLLERRPDEADRRVVRLTLTAAGRRVAAEALTPEGLQAALEDLEAKGLEEALADLLKGLQRANGLRSFGVCRTCRHFTHVGSRFRCGLTGEGLTKADSNRICREHEATAC